MFSNLKLAPKPPQDMVAQRKPAKQAGWSIKIAEVIAVAEAIAAADEAVAVALAAVATSERIEKEKENLIKRHEQNPPSKKNAPRIFSFSQNHLEKSAHNTLARPVRKQTEEYAGR